MIKLWSINRWLRWTGWRLQVVVDPRAFKDDPAAADTVLRLAFYGWADLP